MTGKELAQRILALPEADQELPVYRHDAEWGLHLIVETPKIEPTIQYGPDDTLNVDYFPELPADEGESKRNVLVIR